MKLLYVYQLHQAVPSISVQVTGELCLTLPAGISLLLIMFLSSCVVLRLCCYGANSPLLVAQLEMYSALQAAMCCNRTTNQNTPPKHSQGNLAR